MTTTTTGKRNLVQRIFPKPVRKLFRWMNFHFRDDGKLIRQAAKRLPEAERRQVIDYGKELTTARSKKGFPRATRNVVTSLLVGQGMWYGVCPLLSQIPGIRDHALGWLAWGGSDKLFLSADQLLYHTGGYSSSYAAQISTHVPRTVLFGSLMLGIELLTDFSRCFIENWTQKKYGLVADGVARAYGQVRPFAVRYSSLEAYQKIISYALRPWTIGTPAQIFSSVQGFMGSLWRTGTQLAVVCTVGRALDKFFKKVSEWVGLRKVADRIIDSAKAREQQALDALKGVFGELKFFSLKFQLAAESRKLWNWNPFKPVLSQASADAAAKLACEFQMFERTLAASPDPEISGKIKEDAIADLAAYRRRLESIFGLKALLKMPSFQKLSEDYTQGGPGESDASALRSASTLFSETLTQLQTERELA